MRLINSPNSIPDLSPVNPSCPHCGAPQNTSVPGSPKRKQWTLLLTIPLLLAVVVGSVHFVTGSSVGFHVVRRESFSFSEFFVNVDSITGMPWVAARSRFPLGCRVLQREGVIESNEGFRDRALSDTKREIERLEKEIEAKLRSR